MNAREFLNTKVYWTEDDTNLNGITANDIIEWLGEFALLEVNKNAVLRSVIKGEAEPLLSKELAEKIFNAGGDWRITCKNYTDEKIGKVEWSEGVDFDELWEEISNGL